MSMNQPVLKQSIASPLDYCEIAQSSSFQKLLREKRNFIVPWSLFFMIFYFTLPILTAYTDVLNKAFWGPISWAWVFASAQFVMTWALCIIYTKRAAKFDKMVEEIKDSISFKGGIR
ncbi:DUF485 domain-containing protein [Neobacillus sp. PS3-40]|jgi:uncharacterized membrane protein (DUF485 family)|uniref:DUF485 domain-containing protein n=1 Tax=Neobacillus sp. PS3-40 TaxID=3070679 RepID=UPI0027E1BA8D|nr:DUF485 domain-containing protein [Neobacillus sp. PS3-40]WML46324.1 DUF485 domain-containing protein [Neobacillus sp. PS3-40]